MAYGTSRNRNPIYWLQLKKKLISFVISNAACCVDLPAKKLCIDYHLDIARFIDNSEVYIELIFVQFWQV